MLMVGSDATAAVSSYNSSLNLKLSLTVGLTMTAVRARCSYNLEIQFAPFIIHATGSFFSLVGLLANNIPNGIPANMSTAERKLPVMR